MKTITRYIILITFLSYHLISNIWAQTDDNKSYVSPKFPKNNFRLFDSDDALRISLHFDLGYYLNTKPSQEYIDALLTWHYSPSDSICKKISLKARGNFRYRTCSFPPLTLNLHSASFGFKDLSKINEIKLVSHCDSLPIYEQFMLKEYLVYKLLNVVSDYSFRVRLIQIDYIDVGKDSLYFKKYAIAIEPLNVMLKRINGKISKDTAFISSSYITNLLEKVSVFQYMIGNNDWNLSLKHNVKIVDIKDDNINQLAIIPYDFDFCGFVNSHYAIPRTDLGSASIRDRIFLGPCINEAKLRNILNEFEQYKDDFFDVIKNFEYLDKPVKRDLQNYIRSFFNEYKNDEIITNIKKICISP